MVDRAGQILEELLETVGVGGVERCSAERVELERSLLQPFGVAADQDDLAAACAYLAGGFQSDTRAGADHHDGLVGEVGPAPRAGIAGCGSHDGPPLPRAVMPQPWGLLPVIRTSGYQSLVLQSRFRPQIACLSTRQPVLHARPTPGH